MSIKRYNMVRKGREFEQLVAILEKITIKLGMTIKAPDFIEDKITGTKREIDISIRGMVDSKEYLVILECRDWKRPQDVIWIEQLAGKRDSVGADSGKSIRTLELFPKIRKKGFQLLIGDERITVNYFEILLQLEMKNLRKSNIISVKSYENSHIIRFEQSPLLQNGLDLKAIKLALEHKEPSAREYAAAAVKRLVRRDWDLIPDDLISRMAQSSDSFVKKVGEECMRTIKESSKEPEKDYGPF